MRIARLDLLAYGPFTNHSLDFGDAPALTVVYGANEAGKTAALRAVGGWLFGIDHQTSDDFVHPYKNLRIGGVLRGTDGQRLEYRRRKARTNDLLDPNADDAPLPPAVLNPFLHDLGKERFELTYCLGHAVLREGGEMLRKFKGLAGESLFAAGLGITGLNDVVDQLQSEAEDLYRRGRGKTQISVAKAERDRAHRARTDGECSAYQWDKLRRELGDARQAHANVVERLRGLRTQQSRLKRTASVLGQLGLRHELLAELDADADVLILPAEYDPTQRHEAVVTVERAGRQISSTVEKLDADDGLRMQLERLAPAADLTTQSDAIEHLQTELGAYRKNAADLPKRKAERDLAEKALRRLCADLGIGHDAQSLTSVRLTAEREELLNDLSQRHQSLQGDLKNAEKRQRALEHKLGRARGELDQAPPERDVTELKGALDSAQRKGDLTEQLEAEAGEVAELEASFAAKLGALPYCPPEDWGGDADSVESLAVPVRASIEQFAAEFRTLGEEAAQIHGNRREAEARIAAAEAQMAQLQRGGEVPTEQVLHEARDHRDRGWLLVRADWLEGDRDETATAAFCGERPLADAYESAVTRADVVADEIRRDIDKAVQLERLQADIEAQQQRSEKLEAERSACNGRLAEVDEKWRGMWARLPVLEPGTPAEMAQWLDQFADLRNCAAQRREALGRVRALEATIERHGNALAAALSRLGEPARADDETFGALVLRCASVLGAELQQRQHRASHERSIADIDEDLAISTDDIRAHTEQLDRWQTDWHRAIGALGATEDLTVGEARVRVGQLRELSNHRSAIEELEHRIAGMQSEMARFESQVRVAVEQCAPELAQLPATRTVAELSSRLKQAISDQTRQQALAQQIADLEQELERLEADRGDALASLARFCRLAGVDSPDALGDAEANSARKAEARAKLDELDGRLRDIGGGATVATLIEEAADMDADTVSAEIDEIHAEIDSLEKHRDELAGKVRDCESACEAVDGSAAAAEADEQELAAVARIQELAGQYVRVRLAAALLNQRIENHRAKHQDPMLQRAGVLFSQLTCGSFAGLVVDFDEKDKPIIVGKRAGTGDKVPVAGFSDGTCDQLYLALRLAYLQSMSERGESMPLVLDDILVDFDDERATAALEVLGELAEHCQVILFTHHDHVLQLARKALPPERRTEVHLPISTVVAGAGAAHEQGSIAT